MPASPERNGYIQPSLEGLEVEQQEETILEHVIIERLPTYRKNKKGYTWDCAVYCPPDIFHQDRNESYEVHASTFAPEANKKRLRPGDFVTLKGFAYTQEIQLSGGEQQVVNHLIVTDISEIKHAKQESITVYERKRVDEKKNNNGVT